MTKQSDQHEKDIETTLRYLKTVDPALATREKAEEMLEHIQATSHEKAHQIIDEALLKGIPLDEIKVKIEDK